MKVTIAISPEVGLDPAAFMEAWDNSAELSGGDSSNYLGPDVGNVVVHVNDADDLDQRIRDTLDKAGAGVDDVSISSVEQGDGSLLVSVNP